MSILPRRVGAAVALLAVLLCLPQGVLVLCAGDNGHLAIEAVCAAGPASALERSSQAPAGNHCDCDDACGSCRDSQVGVKLSAGRLREPFAGGPAPVAPASLRAPATTAVLAPPPRFLACARELAHADSPAAAARVAAGVQLRL